MERHGTEHDEGERSASATRLSIGDFSRMTHLSIKALRHYHDLGVLVPVEVDRWNGYRFYSPEQVPAAQVVRRFRDLGMPVEQVREVLDAPDPSVRNHVIVSHLERMESQLSQVEETVRSLRLLLEGPATPPEVEYRSIDPASVLAVCESVRWEDAGGWTEAAFTDLFAALTEAGLSPAGPPGSLYPSEFFELEEGEVTAFIPVTGSSRPDATVGTATRVSLSRVPGAELAIAVHRGAFADLDQTYGALGTVVASQAIGVEGPIREYYLVSAMDTPDVSQHRTEVCWPVFRTS